MTAQIPERILIESKPHWLYARPLDRLLDAHRTEIAAPDARTTACHRQYVGTWDIREGRLWLVNLSTYGVEELPLSNEMRGWFLGLVPTDSFPVYADWFDGHLRLDQCSCRASMAGRRGSPASASLLAGKAGLCGTARSIRWQCSNGRCAVAKV